MCRGMELGGLLGEFAGGRGKRSHHPGGRRWAQQGLDGWPPDMPAVIAGAGPILHMYPGAGAIATRAGHDNSIPADGKKGVGVGRRE